MTNEEAQIVIGNIPIKPEMLDDCYSIAEYQEAKEMAIKALEALEQELTTKNNLGVSKAQIQAEIEMNASRYMISKERGGMGQVEWSDRLIKVSDAVDIIRNMFPVTLQEPRWIPVSERLPEDNTLVLVTVKVGNREPKVRSGSYYMDGHFHIDNGDCWESRDKELLAWMPLPEPYKIESEE